MKDKRRKQWLWLLFAFVSLGLGSVLAKNAGLTEQSRSVRLVNSEAMSVAKEMKPVADWAEERVGVTAQTASPMTSATAKRWTVDELAGEYVHFGRTALSNGMDIGCVATLTKSESDPTELIVSDFIDAKGQPMTLRIKFDEATQTVSFPAQTVMETNEQYFGMDFAALTSEGKPDRSVVFTSAVDENGTFGFTGLWGLVVNDGIYMNQAAGAYNSLYFARPNGTLKADVNMGESTVNVNGKVFVWQPSAYDVMVENFFNNNGFPVQMKLNHDRTATIRSQLAMLSTAGPLYTGNGQWNGENLTAWAKTIVTPASASSTKISWGGWLLYTEANGNFQYMGPIDNTELTLTRGEFNFPQLESNALEGAGSASDPYKIKNVEDLKLFSFLVAEAVDDNADVTKAFSGKYFSLEADLDLTGVDFIPVGNKGVAFNGIFNGNDHQISNLSLSLGAEGYVGLFGRTGEDSEIADLTLVNPSVECSGVFAGSLVGYSKGSVANVKVVNPSLHTTAYGVGGIAGIGVDFSDCTVEGGEIRGDKGYASGIVSECDNGTLMGCAVSGTSIYAGGVDYQQSAPSGGITGYLNGSTMTECRFTGKLEYTGNIEAVSFGGLAGYAKSSEVSRSFFSGEIDAKECTSLSHIGGLIGAMNGKLTDCYSTGRITAKSCTHAGGLTGYITSATPQASVSNCYTAVLLIAKVFKYDPATEVRETLGTLASGAEPTVEHIYYDKQITDFRSATYNAGTETLASGTLPEGFNSNVWTATEGQYPRLKDTSSTEDAEFSATAYSFAPGNTLSKLEKNAKVNRLGATTVALLTTSDGRSNQGHYCRLEGDSIIIGNEMGTDTLVISNGGREYRHFLTVVPHAYEGAGTAESPYLIKTKEQLIALSEATSQNGQKYAETHFLMANDIDMEYDSRFLGIATGSTANSFDGVFDGGGHAVHNLYLDGVYWTTRPEDDPDGLGKADTSKSKQYIGFMGRIGETGKLMNVTIADDADISLWSTSGVFAGENHGLIENCRNLAAIHAYWSWCGGIAGDNKPKGKILGCLNAGDVIGGNMQTGGIAGANSGIIEECMNAGDVSLERIISNIGATSSYSVGGIVGRGAGGNMINVVNAGVITGMKNVGGICGSLTSYSVSGAAGTNSVLGGVSYGLVHSSDAVKIGGIGGETGSASTESKAYWDRQLAPYAANGGSAMAGMEGVLTEALVSGEPLSGLDPDIWQFDAGLYPVLKRFAGDPAAAAARKLIIAIPDGGNVTDLKADVGLPVSEDISMRLALGGTSGFSLEGLVLKVPVAPKALASDTLYLSCGPVEKPVKVMVYPVMPLEGEGTEESPYLINSAEDWNNLAGYTLLKNETFAGKCFTVTDDLDFEGKSFSPMSTNKEMPFGGKISGGNHTLQNISYTAAANQQYTGVFGYIGAGSEISDLAIEGNLSATGTYLGGFAGSLSGTLRNIVNRATVSTTKNYVAGIAALVNAGAKLENCVNAGTVESTATSSISYMGGVAADVKGGVSFTACGNTGMVKAVKASTIGGVAAVSEAASFIECYNTGRIQVTDSASATTVAGILANAKNSTKNAEYVITGCRNESPLAFKADVAGIVATVGNTTAGNVVLKVSGCTNTAPITSLATTASAGVTAGILGKYSAGSVIKDCTNTGAVTSKGAKSTGGILGVKANNSTAAYPILVKNCHNEGDVTSAGYHVSGIMGGEMCAVTVDSCSNTGNIHADQYMAGGIASYTTVKGSVIKHSFNMGNVTVGQSQAGGILGTSTGQVDIQNSWNSGDVASTSTTESTATTGSNCIGGLCGKGGGLITDSHNSGNVTGLVQVGGLVGLPAKDVVKFNVCYSAGEVNASVGGCGGVIGVDPENSSLYWSTGNSATDTYYASDRVASSLPQVGTGVTYATLLQTSPHESYICYDEYSLPVPVGHSTNDAAHVAAAQLVLADGDSRGSVTQPFNVGTPGNVQWSSTGDITFEGNNATLGDNGGKMTLTASAGKYSKNIELEVVSESSVEGFEQPGKKIAAAVYYDLAGHAVAKPTVPDGEVYVVVVTYDDKSVRVFKLLNAK